MCVCMCVCVYLMADVWEGGVGLERGGRRVAVLRLDVAERQLRPAKRRSTDLDVYPQFVFHTGHVLSLSSASLAASMFFTGCAF